MTLEDEKGLLKHFEDLYNGVILQPINHVHWHDVMANAKVRAEKMREHIKKKEASIELKANNPDPKYNVYNKYRKEAPKKDYSKIAEKIKEAASTLKGVKNAKGPA